MIDTGLILQFLGPVWGASEVIVFLRDRQAGAGERKDGGSRVLLLLAITAGIVISIFAAKSHLLPLPGNRSLWVAVGAPLFVIGIIIRHWAVLWLGQYFRTRVTILDEHRLITDGPYAKVRNPSYSGALLTCLGFGIAAGSLVAIAAVVLLPMMAFIYRISVEEQALADHFGDEWIAYRKRTSALIPGIW